MDPSDVSHLLSTAFPGAEIEVTDFTGTGDHFRARIVSQRFRGLGPLDQHKLVYAALAEPMKGAIHALSLETHTPESWARRQAR
ncbi:MAG: BolA/IbaG family iron-sulfur metabolism protein [Polyangiaceae bacterium]|nr:BolA/IbaG family iron-sulfur metabolism protein [Polyangiaceae bacterium]